MGEKGEETEVDLWVLVVGAGVDGGGLVLALLKYPFYPLFILDNGMNLISKSLTVLSRPNYWSFLHLHIYFGGTSFLHVFGLF